MLKLSQPMELRQLTGMSQEELAALLRTSRSNIAMYESTGRSLPTVAGVYYAHLLNELQQSKQQAPPPYQSLNDKKQQQFTKELQYMAMQKRQEATMLQRKMKKNIEKENKRLQRQLLVECVKKVQEKLIALQQDKHHMPIITERHKRWLELEKKHSTFSRNDETVQLQHLKDQVTYNLLLKEVEMIENMLKEAG